MNVARATRTDVAVDLIERYGFSIFPCLENAKAPLHARGHRAATDNAYVARSWFDAYPRANIAAATGVPSGIVVVDIDVRNGTAGFATAAELCGLGPTESPDTLTVDTPSGGQHWYFRHPGGTVRCKTGVRPGVDLKADGGYVLCPNSSVGGRRYDYGLEFAIAPMPPALLEVLEYRRAPAVLDTWDEPDVIAEGGRNDALARFAGHLINAGCHVDEIFAALVTRNDRLCTPPLDELEIRKIAASAARNFGRH